MLFRQDTVRLLQPYILIFVSLDFGISLIVYGIVRASLFMIILGIVGCMIMIPLVFSWVEKAFRRIDEWKAHKKDCTKFEMSDAEVDRRFTEIIKANEVNSSLKTSE